MVATRLVAISGPIASGKSTTAHELANRARAEGRSAATVDLDRVYSMLDDASLMSSEGVWRLARRAAAALANQFAVDGIDLVIVEGDFWTAAAREQFLERLTADTTPTFVTLTVSADEALRRVTLDSGRRASRDPLVLHACHADFALVAPVATDIRLDTTSMTVDEVVLRINSVLRVGVTEPGALLRDVDCVQIPVPDVGAGLAFYRDALGQRLIWRTPTAAGLRLPDCTAEIVIQSERPELEVNLSVASADQAAEAVVRAGGTVAVAPFDIAIGRCTVVRDPWGNRIVLLDQRNGRLVTDANRNVLVNATGRIQTQFAAEVASQRTDERRD